MAVIGRFKRDGRAYVGRVVTLSVQADVRIEEPPEGVFGPWTVRSGLAELGEANRISGGSRMFRVTLDDPSFAAPIVADLCTSPDRGDELLLVWARGPKAEAA